ncbi:MAG: fructose-1,6-bisphosphatase [Methanomicrobiales archaeon]|nr:fructose-1,6-bisphosphatase [Methanomicrobiales archaeon]
MISLREYLDTTRCEEPLKDLIELIAYQAIPIREAFLSNQAYAASLNASGEQQAALDTWSDRHLTNVLQESKLVAELASEEQPDVVRFPGATTNYAVVMDPLDGSSLIQVNLAVGTIVGIFGEGGVLQKGERLRAAMYMLYGPMTVLTITVGEGVCLFALNEARQYVLLSGGVRMPEGNLYGSGGIRPDWTEAHTACIGQIEGEGAKLRYSGSFVADFHQILKYGGVYCYPALKKKEEGKLRLLFEAIPIGFIAAQAGGAISNGRGDILAIEPTAVHQRTPIYVGSSGLIRHIEDLLAR